MDELKRDFERCWPWLEASIDRYGNTLGKDDLWKQLADRRAFLTSGQRCVIVYKIIDYSTGWRSLYLWLVGGDEDEALEELLPLIDRLEAWSKTKGCSKSLIFGRRAWGKVLKEYKEYGTRFMKDL
jgi:hypothetical protein